MKNRPLFSRRLYLKKIFNTFLPRCIFALSFSKNWSRHHWASQDKGDPQGFDKYVFLCPADQNPLIIREVLERARPEDANLDMGCNCGSHLNMIKSSGHQHLSGIDISKNAIEFGKKEFGLGDVSFYAGPFEKILPQLAERNRHFDVIYSVGATQEFAHPSFDIIRHICELAERYVVLSVNEWGHAYPRFWEYEFNRQGFAKVKCIRLSDEKTWFDDPISQSSLIVFQRVV